MPLTHEEQLILDSISIPSDNDPLRPEFPDEDPKFPATPTYKIEISGFKNVWLKDESFNPTGTHKDRMAWEIVVKYRDILVQKAKGKIRGDLPQCSIISSGSAAFAIQTMLKKYGLPDLKVLVDVNCGADVLQMLRRTGCEVYQADLGKRPLHWREILALTNNQGGFDITADEAFHLTPVYYDWMSYEIINSSPDYCFIPFGTGNLYENILTINKKEVSSFFLHDPRFKGNVEALRNCNFMGSTTNNPKSKATKLYSPHLPFTHFDEQWLQSFKYSGYCGPESDIYVLEEKYLDEAMKVAIANNVSCEPSGIAGLALMLQMENRLPKTKKMLVVNTGKTKYENGQ